MDKEALIHIYIEQSKIIYGYLINMGCNSEEAKDIVQESFIKAIEYADGVAVNKLFSWLFKVAINNYKNRTKKKSVLNEIFIDDISSYYGLVLEDVTVDLVISKEKSLDIKICLNKLREGSKSLLILKYHMNLSYKDIGELLGFSEEKVKTYLYRARNEFKRLWREKNGQ